MAARPGLWPACHGDGTRSRAAVAETGALELEVEGLVGGLQDPRRLRLVSLGEPERLADGAELRRGAGGRRDLAERGAEILRVDVGPEPRVAAEDLAQIVELDGDAGRGERRLADGV